MINIKRLHIIKKRLVIETARPRCGKKRSFGKRELFLINLTWNIDSKQSEMNQATVKVIIFKITK